MPTRKLQNSDDFQGQKFYVGIDVHKKSWSVVVRSLGLLVDHFTQPPSVKALMTHLQRQFPGGEFYSAYEAGFSGTGLHEQLCKLGVKNILVHPGDIPRTDKEKKNKTDIHDSRSIAFNLEKGNLHGIFIMPKEQQEFRALFRLRQAKVKDMSRAINRLKGFLLYFGIDYSSNFEGYISAKVITWLRKLRLASEAGNLSLKKYIDDLVYQRAELAKVTKIIRSQAKKDYAHPYKCLLSVPGIGFTTAIGLLAEIGDFNRFKDPAEYCSFLGLIPWQHSSGDSIQVKGIQPRCNKILRPLLVEASWFAIRNDPSLLKYYRKHAVKNSRHAIIKVTRKLALIAKGVVQKLQMYQADYTQLGNQQLATN
ncbi:MAG TPA: IS110 family transposase [Patescibacteria group bacterium]